MRAGTGEADGRTAVSYALVNMPLQMIQGPASIILPSLYVQYAGLDMVVIGILMTLLRLGDAVMDPAIGYLSDRTRLRFGRRRTWVALGAALCVPAVLLVFRPGPATGYVYFTASYFLLTLAWTMVEIPHTAWLSEISHDYGARNRLSTYRYIAGMAGTALFPLISFLPWLPNRAVTPEVTQLASFVAILLLGIAVPAALWLVPDPPVRATDSRSHGIRQVARDLWANRPLRRFIAMQSLTGVSSGMVTGLYYFYVSIYLGLSRDYTSVMLAVYTLSIVGSALWLRIGRIVDKHRIIALCSLFTALTNVLMYVITPGPDAFLLLLVMFSVAAIATSGAVAAQVALLADVADYGVLQSGREHPGNYFALFAFVGKAALAVGSGIGLIIAGLFGFRVEGGNGPLAMTGFFLAIIWIPLALNVLSAALSWFFPLDRRRQAVIARRIGRRHALDLTPAPSGNGAI
ncbi:MFS transporter [Sphingomonas hankookensis]|uniref:MFS transporter n=1 Tax=Sphingomonas hankookensis TaxID=563996 RepID=UPI001F5738EB|nr:MFS transporter [Sphingomonas hankookensis]